MNSDSHLLCPFLLLLKRAVPYDYCRVMTKGDTEGWIFLSYPHMNNGFFFLLTTVFIYLFIYSFIYFYQKL